MLQHTNIFREGRFKIHKNLELAAPYAPFPVLISALNQALVTNTVKACFNSNLQYFSKSCCTKFMVFKVG